MDKRLNHIPLSLGLILGAAAVFGAESADACGGLFCNGASVPVEQNAERILFEVHEPGEISVTVEISYTGDPDKFSWIVPVSEIPSEMAVAPSSALRILDRMTSVQFVPPRAQCTIYGPQPGMVRAESGFEGGGVNVEDLPVVGPYDPEVISSDDPEALIDWLEDNEYLITDEMKPIIAEYVESGYKFMGVKLIPDAGISDISPLKWTCPEGSPLIPIKLTAIAAEPDMGVQVFIAAPSRYAPVNYREIQMDTEMVQMDPATGQSNYYPLASWLIDEEGGKAMITEYAAPMDEVQRNAANIFALAPDAESEQWLSDTLAPHAYFTRFYTRISAWEMTDDPIFQANASGGDVSRVHDLSSRPTVEVCDTTFETVPCGSTYCGAGSQCATTLEGSDGCLCKEGTVARAITVPAGSPATQTITCQETSIDMLQSVSGELANPCDGFSCGAGGTCLPVNGFATCECNGGYAAVNNRQRPNGVRCELVNKVFSPEQLLWPEGSPNQMISDTRFIGGCTCTSTAEHSLFAGLFLLGLLFVMMPHRKRRGV